MNGVDRAAERNVRGVDRSPDAVAAIDVGTNSIHMVVARGDSSRFEIVAREKSVVRLGSGGSDMTRLADDAIERGIEALRRMRRVADVHGAVVRAVATSAVREATNADVFLERSASEANVRIEVISGVEEARLIHLGVMQALPRGEGNTLLIDIGGGSTEIVVSHEGRIMFAQSLKMGAVRFTDRFVTSDRISPAEETALRRQASSTIAAVAHEVRAIGFRRVVVSSGTAETLSRMAAAFADDEPRNLNGYRVERASLDRVVERLLASADSEERAALPGCDARRADIIVAGALIMHQIVRDLGITSTTYSEYALREGVLFDTLQRLDVARSPDSDGFAALPVADAGRDSIARLAARFSVDTQRMEHIAGVALDLFHALSTVHGLDPSASVLLEAAAHLWSTGLSVSHSRYHHHSQYIVRNADLMGFDDGQIGFIALVCRYHRKSHPKAAHEEFGLLADDARHLVRVLAGILRVSIALDRSHDQSTSIAGVDALGDRDGTRCLVIRVRSTAARPDIADLDVYTAQERTGLLAEALDCTVEIRLDPTS